MNMDTILPGSGIGILGDGQLGKMTAMAAAQLGYKAVVLGPGGRESPAGHVAYSAKKWGSGAAVDEKLLEEFCRLVSVVLIEWENVPLELVEKIEAKGIPVRPSSKVLKVAQDRLLEKDLAEKLGIPVPPFRKIDSLKDLGPGFRLARGPSILKTRRNGYDGKGQIRIPSDGSIKEAWKELGEVPCILEDYIDFAGEVSIIIAHSPHTSDMAAYGPFENIHKQGILRHTKYPVANPRLLKMLPKVTTAALDAAQRLALHLKVHGLLAVEFFVKKSGTVLFNEMAPRPHNSGHLTIECAYTSQYGQYVRAACNLPFGSTHFHSGGEMINLIGAEVHGWLDYAGGIRSLHLYGKDAIKEGRKMGHVVRRIKS